MNYRIEAPDGIWTKKIVETHLGGDAFLRVVITQANLKEPIVVESAEMGRRSSNLNHHVPVAVRNVEVIDRRGNPKLRPFTDMYPAIDRFENIRLP